MKSIGMLNSMARIPVDTIYFGGGTPNVLAKATFEQLVSAIYDQFNVADECGLPWK